MNVQLDLYIEYEAELKPKIIKYMKKVRYLF